MSWGTEPGGSAHQAPSLAVEMVGQTHSVEGSLSAWGCNPGLALLDRSAMQNIQLFKQILLSEGAETHLCFSFLSVHAVGLVLKRLAQVLY